MLYTVAIGFEKETKFYALTLEQIKLVIKKRAPERVGYIASTFPLEKRKYNPIDLWIDDFHPDFWRETGTEEWAAFLEKINKKKNKNFDNQNY